MQPQPYDSLLSVSYRPEEHVLVARWLLPMQDEAAYQASYATVLDLAARHQCPFWLLDVRRALPSPARHGQWLLSEFCPRLTPVLRTHTPVHSAYLVNPLHLPDYTQQVLPLLAAPSNTCYRAAAFVDEGPVAEWLRSHQPAR